MARFSKSVLSYRDVHQVFEAAGLKGEVKLTFDTPAKAVTWNGRANAYRVLLREQNKAAGRDFTCEFDHLVVSRKAGIPEVIIRPRGFGFTAIGPDGKEIDFNKQTLEGPVSTPHEKTQAQKEIDAFLDGYEAETKGGK
jgi:hypothetical protein